MKKTRRPERNHPYDLQLAHDGAWMSWKFSDPKAVLIRLEAMAAVYFETRPRQSTRFSEGLRWQCAVTLHEKVATATGARLRVQRSRYLPLCNLFVDQSTDVVPELTTSLTAVQMEIITLNLDLCRFGLAELHNFFSNQHQQQPTQ